MAKAAAKKKAKAGGAKAAELKVQLAVLNAIYLVVRFLLKRATVSGYDWAAFAFLGLCYAISFNGQVETAGGSPGDGELYFDLYVITALAQMISMFSLKGMYLFLTIPAYGAYFLFSKFFGGSSGSGSAPEQELSAADKKRLEKKERKAQRGKVVRARR
mmetsp:Transcript_25251/g.79227  ORF Transcript_25251/g.79227 Transcript_25251/m.79227 type:complete len:159 (+) Transcript_25251:124-600(+)